jgi:hypothetical protein
MYLGKGTTAGFRTIVERGGGQNQILRDGAGNNLIITTLNSNITLSNVPFTYTQVLTMTIQAGGVGSFSLQLENGSGGIFQGNVGDFTSGTWLLGYDGNAETEVVSCKMYTNPIW